MKRNKKCLVLLNARWDIDRYFIEHVDIEQVKVAPIYKLYKKDFKYKVAVLWMEKCRLPFESLWYEDWKKEIENYDTVIINALNLSWKILSFIHYKNPHARLIVWYWDTVNDKNRLPDKYKPLCEVWSFDEKDCSYYGFKKNTQFYYPLPVSHTPVLYDAMFVGQDKGRAKQLQQICTFLQQCGLTVYSYVQRYKKGKVHPEHPVRMPLPYKDVVSLVAHSRCIIDIPKQGQAGLTMRVLESLFYAKKLITTDKNIAGADFFHPANIFIWDNPSPNDLLNFFSLPVVTVDEEILNRYTFQTWISNFDVF